MPVPLVILLMIFGAIVAVGLAFLLVMYVLVPLFKGLGWFVGHVFRFIGGEIGDAFRTVGAALLVLIFTPLILLNVVIGRWSASAHFGRALQHEIATMGTCLYRMIVGHPARLLGLGGVTEGIERRLPEVVAAAPGRDKPTKRTGQFEGYKIVGSLRGGGSGGKLYIAEPDEMRLASFARAGQDGVDRVVIKSFSLRDGSSLPQIVRESRALDAAKKLGLVLDHELNDERFYYAMRYVPGDSLGVVTANLHALSGSGGLDNASIASAMTYAADLLSTLEVYHRGGLWHKDVKPDNIIVHDDRAHLVDLGLVTPMRSAMTLTTHGTEYFRDPEMVRLALKGVKVHQVDGAKFDIYAVGAVLYSMVENSFPAHGGLSQVSKRCPEALRWVIRRAMTDYDKRYEHAEQMLADLEAIRVAADPFSVKPMHLPSMGGGLDAPDHEPEPIVVEAAATPVPPRGFDAVWQRIVSLEGEKFETVRGKPFTYTVSNNILVPSIESKFQLHKSNFKQAFDRGPTSGPGAISDVMGPSYVWAILHDDRIGAFAGRIAARRAPPPPPPPPADKRERPRLRVANWWTGGYVRDDGPRPAHAQAKGVGFYAGMGPRGRHASRRVGVPRELRAPASEQLKHARERARAARQRALSRPRPGRARPRHEGDPSRMNAGVGFAVLAFIGAIVGITAVTVNKMKAEQASITTEENPRFFGSGPLGIDLDGETLGKGAFEVISMPAELQTIFAEGGERLEQRLKNAVADAEDGRFTINQDETVKPAVDTRMIFINDFDRSSLPEPAREGIKSGLGALSLSGVKLMGDFAGAEPDEIDLVARLVNARGSTPLDSTEAATNVMGWIDASNEVDLVLWIEPVSESEDCSRYLIVGKGGMLRGVVPECLQLWQVFERALQAAVDWR